MALMSAISLAIFFFGGNIGRIYTNDPEVLEVLSDVTPIIAIILWSKQQQQQQQPLLPQGPFAGWKGGEVRNSTGKGKGNGND